MYNYHKRSSLDYPQRFISYDEFVEKFEMLTWEGYYVGARFIKKIPALQNVSKYGNKSKCFLKYGEITFNDVNYRMSKKDYFKMYKYLKERLEI